MKPVERFAESCTDPRQAAESYTPHPIDTEAVDLPPDVAALAERLAHNTHEIWSHQRLKDGWRWGPERDDNEKQHPGLLPYDCLSESEKEYDRVITVTVLKALLALGYQITPSR